MSALYPRFMFTYWNCATPTISDISPRQVTATESITISGIEFSLDESSNDVTVGSSPCVVTESTQSEIKCTLQSNNETRIAVPHYVQLNVRNKGYALNTIQNDFNRHVIVLPHIRSVSPTSGSTEGGARLTIQGGGFQGEAEDITVAIDGVLCLVESVQYDTIQCITKASSVSTHNISVTTTILGQSISAKCVSNCEFTFSAAHTPEVSSFSPSTITSDGEQIIISGNGFGNALNDVTITVGDVENACSVASVSGTEIICTMSGVHAGTQPWSVHISGKGYASLSSATITVDGSITSVTPSTGGTNGGNVITIIGLGFNQEDIEVDIDGSQCEIIEANATTLTCKVPAGSSGSQDIVVQSNGETFPSESYTYDTSITPEVSGVTEQVIYFFSPFILQFF